MAILHDMWKMLDDAVTSLVEGNPIDLDRSELKGRCAGYADYLCVMMQPFYRTREDVSREAMKRYKAHKAGDDRYESPGLGSRQFEFPGQESKYTKSTRTAVPVQGGPSSPPKLTKLSPKDREGILKAKDLMSATELARVYSVHESEIVKVWNSSI